MITFISPAINMKRNDQLHDIVQNMQHDKISRPELLEKTKLILAEMKKYQPWELESRLQTNEKLAAQAFMDYQDFNAENIGYPAILGYDGLVFKNIKAESLSLTDMEFMNQHVRILSGLYGTLRPMDGIIPYRLEMRAKICVDKTDLYGFWGDTLYKEIVKHDNIILNLASEEYAKCIRKYIQMDDTFIDVDFQVVRRGFRKNITAWAKMARGQMIRYIVENNIDNPKEIQNFEWNDFYFEPTLSYERKYIFLKDDF